ncbi:MAG: pentapeptide repeat-containing protein [Cyanobacteria bacterium CAN_BIN43]|nr:pentapeptide repeat-containing protein [Cyanobacteria bacterium CAN_BIN43]
MPRLVSAQPLPQDLRNRSFQGSCEGWNFEGRDIRGCDFRNAKLKGANFSQVTAGRSRKQIIIDLLIVVAFAFVVAVAFAFAFAFSAVFVVVFASAFAVIFASGFVGAFAGAVAGSFAGAFGVTVYRAINAFSKGQMLEGILFSVVAIFCLPFSLYCLRQAIREFKNATGTNFKGADLQGANFSHATLSNCDFDQADTNYIN